MQTYARYCFPLLILSGLFLAFTARGETLPTIAVFSGSMPTIQNSRDRKFNPSDLCSALVNID